MTINILKVFCITFKSECLKCKKFYSFLIYKILKKTRKKKNAWNYKCRLLSLNSLKGSSGAGAGAEVDELSRKCLLGSCWLAALAAWKKRDQLFFFLTLLLSFIRLYSYFYFYSYSHLS